MIELIIVVAIVGALAAFALPKLKDAIDSYRADADINNMVAFLQSVRSLAIVNESLITVFEPDATGNKYSFKKELVAIPTNSLKIDYSTVKTQYTACTPSCIKLQKPAINSKSLTSIVYVQGQGTVDLNDFGVAYDRNGLLYFIGITRDSISTPLGNRPPINHQSIVFYYQLGTQKRSIVMCSNGLIAAFNYIIIPLQFDNGSGIIKPGPFAGGLPPNFCGDS